MAHRQNILFEGAQGTMLDIDHGTYPFVTSSSASAGGAATGTGVPPTRIHGVIGVSKAYITRVGSGPFPTESHDGGGEMLRREGKEFGAVTGRPRRCGWFDAPLLRYTAMVNGFDTLMITKLDVLDSLDEIPVCIGYRLKGQEITEMPATYRALEAIEPVYQFLPGWKTSTRGIPTFEALPERAKAYLNFLEEKSGVEIGGVSTGPERNETIIRPGSKMASLIA
jgi:adenylosuccinate synthase